MVEIKTPEQISRMRAAGLVVAEIHRATAAAAVPGATTKDLDDIAAQVLADHGAKPNFLGYGGYPAHICTSVNDVVVHGIPDRETVLKPGDIISIDAGAIVDGWHADAAVTVFVGEGHPPEVRELSRVTEASLWAGLAAVRRGNRLVDISKAIEGYIRRQPLPPSGKYGIIEQYGGHGIGSAMHMDPHILNYVDRGRGRGPKLVPGMCLAIEPMVSLGTPKTHVLADEWTVKTDDGTWAAHWEHSVALTEEGPLVLTAPDGGRERLAQLGVTVAPDPLA
ncbi:type I methionyl aminopeptidase [Streptomyces sp. 7-21]|jgi:methionyl aminopeptidase|uniref:type I methionyl aminopeptidase n=1 Tax=Streptomyces sp. 7-21 TaxID=2802283 RepID=UPI00191F0A49|nr:type I methionyl aminopeptidase [Streptomyces sp. 7-21]MBL1065618.1 type I methionyl aminopeptidase [Streptomyces sp. 7-21]